MWRRRRSRKGRLKKDNGEWQREWANPSRGEEEERERLWNNEHGREQAVNVVCLCVFVPVCVSGDSQWGQRVSVAPCVAYKLIKDNPRRGKHTAPLPTPVWVRQGRVQGQRQKRKKRKFIWGVREACSLQLVLKNGLQIEIEGSGSTHIHITIQGRRRRGSCFHFLLRVCPHVLSISWGKKNRFGTVFVYICGAQYLSCIWDIKEQQPTFNSRSEATYVI